MIPENLHKTSALVLLFVGAALAIGACASRTSAERCSTRNASLVAFYDIANAPRDYDARCVRVRGLWRDFSFYSDIEGYYRAEGPRDISNEVKHRIGLYAPRQILDQSTHFDAAEAEVIGVVSQCEYLHELLLVSGYCHFSDGPYIDASSIQYKSVPFVRLAGDANRSRVGNLDYPPLRWPLHTRTETLAREWLSNIESGDFKVSGEESLPPAESILAPFVGKALSPKVQIFAPRVDDMDPQLELEAIMCICKSPDCTDKWPITTLDAENNVSRPYLCAEVWLEHGVDGAEDRYVVDAMIDRRRSIREPPQ